MKILYSLLALTLLGCQPSDNKNVAELIVPKWKIGDVRYFKETGSMFATNDTDTVINTEYNKILRLEVLDKDTAGYIVNVNRLPIKKLEINTTIESIFQITKGYNRAMELVKKLSEFKNPYKLRISLNGELMDIINPEEYITKYKNYFLNITDTLSIPDSIKSVLINRVKGNAFANQCYNEIINETSELLDIYNIKNPINGAVVEQTNYPDPKSGEILPVTLTYKSNSIINNIQEIQLTIKLEESLMTSLEANEKSDKKIDPKEMKNLTIYHLDTTSGWLTNSTSVIEYESNEFKLKMNTNLNITTEGFSYSEK